MPTRKEILEAWVAGYPKGQRILWFGATEAKEEKRWLPGVVTGTKVVRLDEDACVFFRLDSEQSLRMPHEVHWEYRNFIKPQGR